MTPLRGDNRALIVVGAAVAVALTAGSTLALGAASGAWNRRGAHACSVPQLPGAVVHVRLADMGSMMQGRAMGGGMNSPQQWQQLHPGMMRVMPNQSSVRSGTVSIVADNVGSRTHELVVLPLGQGRSVGQRRVDEVGKVDESASVGEASASCANGAGDGIATSQSGWTTISLAPGRYELVCNLPGHYLAGMYAELDVVAS